MDDFKVSELAARAPFICPLCGKEHRTDLREAIVGRGALGKIPDAVRRLGGTKVFLLDDANTREAAGERVRELLRDAGIPYTDYTMGRERIEPDEKAVGSVILHFDRDCDCLVGVGSGVINDIGKIVSGAEKIPYLIAGTAPSMDGYASGTSSVIRDGLKVSVDSRTPDIVVGDTDVLMRAPARMRASGIGDMFAKYVSLCEWRISALINGEYYCPTVADMVRCALEKIRESLRHGADSEEAAEAVMEGLILSGIAAGYAGLSRPVSGTEHYFSHVWDMRNAAFGTPFDLHGIQCGIGTYDTLLAYAELKKIRPDREKALRSAASFDLGAWNAQLREKVGPAAETMIAQERNDGKYDPVRHEKRLDRILANYDAIRGMMDDLPSPEEIADLLRSVGAPIRAREIGLTESDEYDAFRITKDIRNKYILSTLLWDLGELDDIAQTLFRHDA